MLALSLFIQVFIFDFLSHDLEIKWKREWFPRLAKSQWSSTDARKNFLDEVSKKLNIKNPSDWGSVKIQTIQQLGGSGLLSYYKGSLFICLKSIYKGLLFFFFFYFSLNEDRYRMEKRMVF